MTIRITASRHTAFYSPLICTMAAGFLEKHGLDFTYGVLPAGETAAGMIRDGKTDIMQSAPSTNWAKMEKGETGFPPHFALINQRDGFFLTGRAPFVWKDLEGKSILADHGSQPLAMLRYAIQYNGVDLAKVALLKPGSGPADFIHLQAPEPQPNILSLGSSTPPNAFSSLCASREFIAASAFRAFVKAFAEAKEWVRQTAAEEIADVEASYFPDVSHAALTWAIAQYKGMGAWDSGPEIPRDLYEQSLNVFEWTGAISRRQPYDAVCLAPQFLHEALA